MKKNTTVTLRTLTGLFMTITIVLMVFVNNVKAQSYDAPESVVYDESNDRYLVSNMLGSDIVARDQSGNLSVFYDVSLSYPRGMVIVGNTVYVSNGNKVTGIDLSTADSTFDLTINGASSLNDIETDNQGNLFVSDDVVMKIYKIKISDKSYTEFVKSGLDSPNGLLLDEANNRLILCSFSASPIQGVDLGTGAVSTLKTVAFTLLDGLARDHKGNIYVSSWETNKVYKFNSDFTVGPEVFDSGYDGPADLYFDDVNYRLAVPDMNNNDVRFIQLTPPVGLAEDVNPLSLNIYPNPVDDQFAIRYTLQNNSKVEIDILDIAGRLTSNIISEFQTKGAHTLTGSINKIVGDKGVYLVRVKTSNGSSVRKLIVR